MSIDTVKTPSSGVGHSTSAIPTGKSIGPENVETVINVSGSRFVVPLTFRGSPIVTASTGLSFTYADSSLKDNGTSISSVPARPVVLSSINESIWS